MVVINDTTTKCNFCGHAHGWTSGCTAHDMFGTAALQARIERIEKALGLTESLEAPTCEECGRPTLRL